MYSQYKWIRIYQGGWTIATQYLWLNADVRDSSITHHLVELPAVLHQVHGDAATGQERE